MRVFLLLLLLLCFFRFGLLHAVPKPCVCDLQMNDFSIFGGISILTFRSASIIHWRVCAYRCVCTMSKMFNFGYVCASLNISFFRYKYFVCCTISISNDHIKVQMKNNRMRRKNVVNISQNNKNDWTLNQSNVAIPIRIFGINLKQSVLISDFSNVHLFYHVSIEQPNNQRVVDKRGEKEPCLFNITSCIYKNTNIFGKIRCIRT